MRTIEERFVDKKDWPIGPWMNEPDKIQWQDEKTNLPCLIVRNNSGALCGYVGVPNTHPFFKKEYEECDVEVHGGLTFSSFCTDGKICHKVEEGEDDHVWWLGFDCSHALTLFHYSTLPDSTYKDVTYVKSECERLAVQLKALL